MDRPDPGILALSHEGEMRMAKAVWTGSLSFGLVNVPVGLYSATEDRSIHFNQFRAGSSENKVATRSLTATS
jgi:non-homologous end joining protein Ku